MGPMGRAPGPPGRLGWGPGQGPGRGGGGVGRYIFAYVGYHPSHWDDNPAEWDDNLKGMGALGEKYWLSSHLAGLSSQ